MRNSNLNLDFSPSFDFSTPSPQPLSPDSLPPSLPSRIAFAASSASFALASSVPAFPRYCASRPGSGRTPRTTLVVRIFLDRYKKCCCFLRRSPTKKVSEIEKNKYDCWRFVASHEFYEKLDLRFSEMIGTQLLYLVYTPEPRRDAQSFPPRTWQVCGSPIACVDPISLPGAVCPPTKQILQSPGWSTPTSRPSPCRTTSMRGPCGRPGTGSGAR